MSPAGTKGVPRKDRELQILAIATAEFGDRGYANASVADIASAAGVSPALIYTYFGSRDGLHEACVHRAGGDLVRGIGEAQVAPGAASRALATLDAIFRVLDGRTELWTVVYDPTLPRPSRPYSTARHYQDALNGMGSEGVREVLAAVGNADARDHSLLLALWFSAISTTITWWRSNPDSTAADMTHRCARLYETLC